MHVDKGSFRTRTGTIFLFSSTQIFTLDFGYTLLMPKLFLSKLKF